MKPLLILAFVFCFTNCSERNEKNKLSESVKSVDSNFHKIDSFGTLSPDTSKFVKLLCGLYINSKGILAYKAVDYSYGFDKPMDVYLSTIYNADLSDSINNGTKEMKDVVDTATFQIIGEFYFKDKNHIYDFSPMSDGGAIEINRDADVKTFHLLESELYAKDKKNCYYRGRNIKAADLSSFKVLDTLYSWHTAYDKNNYYNGENKMQVAEIKKENLDSIRVKKRKL